MTRPGKGKGKGKSRKAKAGTVAKKAATKKVATKKGAAKKVAAKKPSSGTASARNPAPTNAGGTKAAGGDVRAAAPGGGERSSTSSTGAAAPGAGGVGTDVAAPLARFFLWADSPLAVHRLILGLGALCAFLFLFDIFHHRHVYVPGEGLWGFYAIAGFVSFTLIVLGAKSLRTLIRRDETYYGGAAIDGEAYPERGLERRAATEGEEADALLDVRDARVVGDRS